MKVNLDITKKLSNPTFQGFNHKKSNTGSSEFEFNFPHDSGRYDCYLEVFSLNKDNDGNYNVNKILTNADEGLDAIKIDNRGKKVDMSYSYEELSNSSPFAYRYKLVDKKNRSNFFYQVDAGAVLDYSKNGNFDKFNVVTTDGSKVSKGGAMTLALPDSYSVGWVYDENGKPKLDKNIQEKAKNAVKTFSNKLGGTLAGLEANVDKLKKAGYSRVVSTPIFTDDSLSAHSYWNKNCMQMSSALGNIDNYASLQKSFFKAGINLISDGAFVNEGLEGIHFKNMLKWGEKSPYYNWFRANGLESGPLSMGVFAKNKDFIEHKIVNSPYKYAQDANGQVRVSSNEKYNAKKPTFVQIFDKRLVSDEVKNDTTKLIKSYDKLDNGNALAINDHNDTVIPYSFEINPETYNNNVKLLNQYNKKQTSEKKLMLDKPLAAKFLTTSERFILDEKFESGFETWDANTDIAKLNFVFSHADTKRLQSLSKHDRDYEIAKIKTKNFEAQDYVVNSGKYWTRKTSDILNEHVANTLKNVSSNPQEAFQQINKMIKNGELPEITKEKVSEAVVRNVLNDNYETKTSKLTSDYKDLMLQSAMNLPLDSIELADDTVSVLSSSYITNRATKADLVGTTRFDLYKNNNPHLTKENAATYKKADSIYTEELFAFENEVMQNVNKELGGKLFEGNKVTKLGKYVLPLVAQDITKFAIIKAVSPNEKVSIKENGTISYDYDKMKESTTLESMGILADSPEDEANLLINKLKSGIKNISTEDKSALSNAIVKRLNGINENSFALAEMIVDRTNSGLDWRIDAAKDIADMDALRNSNGNFKESWSNVVDFWKNFTKEVLNENKNAYLVAEVTDEYFLQDKSGKYSSAKDAVMKLHQETGMTSIANYSYFFTDLATTFSKDLTNGSTLDEFGRTRRVYDKLVGGDNYLNSAPLDSILYSYTFVGNHDKPRMLHCLSLDMELFHTDFGKNENHRKIATSILKNKPMNKVTSDDAKGIDFNMVSNKAIAMGDAIRGGFEKSLNKVVSDTTRRSEIYSAISSSVADLAGGKYLGKEFSADAFGTKPFDVVIKTVLSQAEKQHGLILNNEEKTKLFNSTFETILKPGMSKFNSMIGFLVTLPGNPTMYAGDELGITGYDEKAKNVYLQSRSFLHWEWLNDENKKFIQKFYNDMNKTMALRTKPELKALNDGAPFTLDLHKDTKSEKVVQAILRQSSDGAMAISLFNANGVNLDKQASLKPAHINLDSISLHTTKNSDKVGLKSGLKVGTTFRNADESDKSLYKVCENNGQYFIKRFANNEAYQNFVRTGSKNFTNANTIDVNTTSMILYSVPEEEEKTQVSFKGSSKVMFNPTYNIVKADSYEIKNSADIGSKLVLLAK